MSYRRCPACSALNREQDDNCFSCQGDLASLEAEQTQVQVLEDTHAQIERRSTLYQGLRAGAASGAFLGLCAALWINLPGRRRQAMLFTHDLGVVMALSLKYYLVALVFCTMVGAVVGKSNQLCYDQESSVVGGFTGALLGLPIWLLTGPHLFFGWFSVVIYVLGAAVAGAVAGSVICFVERKYFRGIHVELNLNFHSGWWRGW